MPFDENLAARIRKTLARKKGIEEKKMFGGIVFMLSGNMLVGVWKDSLIVRLGEDQAEAAFRESYVKPFDITGRPMKNWVMVKPDGFKGGRPVEGVDSAGRRVCREDAGEMNGHRSSSPQRVNRTTARKPKDFRIREDSRFNMALEPEHARLRAGS